LQQRILLSEAFELFVLDAQSRASPPATKRFYRERLGLFLAHCTDKGVLQVDALTPAIIRSYLAHLQSRELSSPYVHSFGRAIRTFCNFLVWKGLLDVSPFAKVKMPRLEKSAPSAYR